MIETVSNSKMRSQSWLWLNVTALGFALAHVFIDFHIGLFGETSHHMSPLQAGNILMLVLINAWWILCLSAAVNKKAEKSNRMADLTGVFVIVLVWAFLFNGLVAVVAAPPPSAAFPYQDISHFGSLIFGGLAAWTTWSEMKLREEAVNHKAILAAGLIILVFMVVNGALTIPLMLG
jgi:hypothetical protein